MPNTNPSADRSVLLRQMAEIDSMERGTLSEEFRERPDGAGGAVRLGPYFKYQVWEEGANRSRRVPPEEVPQLREDLENHQRFNQLAEAFAETTIAQTRAKRAQAKAGSAPEAKKNSRRKSARKSLRKPKPSSS
jgi:hypothetical protein